MVVPHTLRLLAPAKINSYLEILGRRADGFHNLETVFCTLDWADEVIFTRQVDRTESSQLNALALAAGGKPPQDTFSCSQDDLGPLSQNLAWRASASLAKRRWHRASLRAQTDQKLPAGGGLGGGSSDAAAVLRGMQQLADKPSATHKFIRLLQNSARMCHFF